MKKLIIVTALLLGYFGFSQGGPKVDVIKFRGEVTTTIRNTFDVPTGETWLIWNVTTGSLQIAGSTDVWTDVNGSTGNIYPATTGTYVIGSEDLAFIDIWSTYHTIAPASTAYYNWILTGDLTGAGTLSFQAETSADSDAYATRYTLHPSGTPTNATDLVDKAYVDGVSTDNQTAAEVSVSAAGFDGNLSPTDDTVQEVAQKVDDLSLSAGTVTTSGTPVANDIARFTDASTIEGRSYAELKADLDLEIGTDVQAYSATMDTDNTDDIVASGTPVDNQVAIFTGANTAEGDTNLTWDGQIMRMKNHLYLVGAPTTESAHLRFYQNDGTTLAGALEYGASAAYLDLYNSIGGANFRLLNSGTATLNTDFDVTGSIAVTTNVSVADDPYAAGWNGSADVPTKNAVYDKIEALNPLPYAITSVSGGSAASITYANTNITESGTAAGIQKQWNQHSLNDTIVLDATITEYESPFVIQPWGADSLYVKKGTSTTFYVPEQTAAVTEDGIIVKGRNPLTVVPMSSNVFFIAGNYETLYSEVTAYSINNEYLEASAMNADNYTAGIGSWTMQNGSSTTALSATTDAPSVTLGSEGSVRYNEVSANGTARMQIASNGTNISDLTTSADYIVRFYYKRVDGDTAGTGMQFRVDQTTDHIEVVTTAETGAWTLFTSSTWTADDTQPNFWITGSAGATATDDFYISNFEILEQP